MQQFYAPYSQWEDFNNGMYCSTVTKDENQIIKAKSLLSNPIEFKNTLIKLLKDWPISTKVNLTNKGANRRAWLGAAACNHKHGVTEINTRYAWGELNDIQRFNANTIAELIITDYERKNSKLYKGLGKEMLF